jgi:hypothetical protein
MEHTNNPRNYSTWSAAQTSDHTTSPNTPNYSVPPVGLDSYLQVNNSSAPDLHSPPTTSSTIPPPRQYAYHPSAPGPSLTDPLRFVDSNPRPSKSPRHVAPPEIPPIPSNYSEYGARFAPPYSGNSNNDSLPSRNPDYFHPPHSVGLQPWSGTTGPETGVVYGTSQAPGVQHYEFPNEGQFVKEEVNGGQPHYTWNSS